MEIPKDIINIIFSYIYYCNVCNIYDIYKHKTYKCKFKSHNICSNIDYIYNIRNTNNIEYCCLNCLNNYRRKRINNNMPMNYNFIPINK